MVRRWDSATLWPTATPWAPVAATSYVSTLPRLLWIRAATQGQSCHGHTHTHKRVGATDMARLGKSDSEGPGGATSLLLGSGLWKGLKRTTRQCPKKLACVWRLVSIPPPMLIVLRTPAYSESEGRRCCHNGGPPDVLLVVAPRAPTPGPWTRALRATATAA